MGTFQIKKGLDIPLAGNAAETLEDNPRSPFVAINPPDFGNIKFRLLVQEGDEVIAGTPVIAQKDDDSVVAVSPVAGKISQIVRGERRKLLSIVIETSDSEEKVDFGTWDSAKIKSSGRDDLIAHMKQAGFWTLLRQRPFAKIADSQAKPKAIFVNGMDSAPGAGNPDFILNGRDKDLALGLEAIAKLADGIPVNLCSRAGSSSSIWKQSVAGVTAHTFAGPHPSGLVGTHIGMISPINKGECVWFISAEHVADLGAFLTSGNVVSERIIALSGAKVEKPRYLKVTRGAQLSSILKSFDGIRAISGTVLFGDSKKSDEFIGEFASSVAVVEEENEQHYMMDDKHWAGPGFKSYSVWRLFASKLLGKKEWALGTNLKGGHRAIIHQSAYEQYSPLDIPFTFLVKAIPGQDIDRLEQLGLLEIEPEDVALATFVCPSKVDVCAEVADALAMVEKES